MPSIWSPFAAAPSPLLQDGAAAADVAQCTAEVCMGGTPAKGKEVGTGMKGCQGCAPAVARSNLGPEDAADLARGSCMAKLVSFTG
mmetsp:Transcript_9641/g.26906  ORF Transcript_9641/g.26906 Transcript_9641/m.26906 type:complete len:86 (+) Transcript_9641:1051-1308(+)